MANKRRRIEKLRGSREHGRGRKKGRGSGLRGGVGNAGSFGHKVVHYRKVYGDRYFGRHGFKRPVASVRDVRAVNVGELERLLASFEAEGHVVREGDVTVVDLAAAGYDKLLGGGAVERALRVKVTAATPRAVEKLHGQGGGVETPPQA